MNVVYLLTGNETDASLRKMCINCTYSQYNADNKTFTCCNEDVMSIGFEKVKNAAKEFGFDIDTLTLKPMVLKAPTKKCDKYNPNIEVITKCITDFFTQNNE